MTDSTPDAEICDLLRIAFGDVQSPEIVATVVESMTGCEVVEIDGPRHRGDYELWMGEPSAWDGDDLSRVKSLFEVIEVGVYGDPNLAGTNAGSDLDGKFHAILLPDPDE